MVKISSSSPAPSNAVPTLFISSSVMSSSSVRFGIGLPDEGPLIFSLKATPSSASPLPILGVPDSISPTKSFSPSSIFLAPFAFSLNGSPLPTVSVIFTSSSTVSTFFAALSKGLPFPAVSSTFLVSFSSFFITVSLFVSILSEISDSLASSNFL